MASLLLKNGTALIHSAQDDHVDAVKTDILISGNKISQIGKDLTAPSSTTTIDCTDKIISPGFVDTHHHVWQTPLKGRHANQTFIEYMPSGNWAGAVFRAEDVFWGQLGGCLEMLDGGTTTVADFAHINYSAEHNHNAVSATLSSGIRSVYGYSFNPRLSSVDPFVIDNNAFSGHAMSTFEDLASLIPPTGEGRVRLGVAWDGFPYTPKEYVDVLMGKVAEYGIELIQTHISWKPGKPSAPQAIEQLGVLDGRFLMAHSNMSKADAELYRRRGVHYSSTPSTESQMALAFPVMAFREDLGVRDLGSLGVDCHTNNAAFMPGEARLGLQSARAQRCELAEKKGQMPVTVGYSVEEAFNLATIQGARAMKMADRIGSIAEGKRADLVIFDGNSPAMICAGMQDPVAAVILHSSPADVDTVIVDGVVRKRNGRLRDVELDAAAKAVAKQESVSWTDVARSLLRSRERIERESSRMDVRDAQEKTMQAFDMTAQDLGDP